jgi:hypothetical protein
MPDRRDDDLDSWLNQRTDPLAPPPGTFDLIKRRARRRKYRKLAITAASAAVIVAAAVTVPQVVNLQESPSPSAQAAAGQSSAAAASASASAGGGSAAASGAATVPSPSPSAAPVPANFRPTSVTFVGTNTGWVIGQAGTPGQCATQYCTSIARTDNAGKTWYGVPAPLAGPANGATGVSQVRFLNLKQGWAFGPELFETSDAGLTWTPVKTNGLRVTDLETVGNRAFAIFASCTGRGTDFAAGCTSFTLYSAPATGGTWTPVGAATSGLTDGAASEAASLTLTSTHGFLLAPDGKLYAGPVDGSGEWQLVNAISSSCPVGTPQPDGQPSGALLGAVSAKELILGCATSSAGGQKKLIFSSLNGGGSWIGMAVAPTTGTAASIAASPSVSVVLATDQGIDLLPAGDSNWQAASLGAAVPDGGFSYVGMTTDQQGVALPASPAAGTVWFTFDGGKSWRPSPVKG